jgi:TonB family protein
MRILLLVHVTLLFLLLVPLAQAQVISVEEEFLPHSKTHLRGRRIDPTEFQQSGNGSKPEAQTSIDLKAIVLGELQRVRRDTNTELAKAGISSSFKEIINNVPVEGRFEVLALYAPVSDNYLRTMERAIRANVYPPIIARTVQQAATVTVTFVVRKDGVITQIEKEGTTGSAALDATAISACRSASPLPPPPAVKVDDVVRMRFVLIFNPVGDKG